MTIVKKTLKNEITKQKLEYSDKNFEERNY